MPIKMFILVTSSSLLLIAVTTMMAESAMEKNNQKVKINSNGVSIETSDRGVFIESGRGNGQSIQLDDNSVRINNGDIYIEEPLDDDVYIRNEDRNIYRSDPSFDPDVVPTNHETSISLNVADLKQPHILKVKADAANARFSGQIKIDGETVQTLRGNYTALNLSPRLVQGRHLIEIMGNYSPEDSTVTIEFSGSSTQVTQQTGGDGKLMQVLSVYVQ